MVITAEGLMVETICLKMINMMQWNLRMRHTWANSFVL